MSTKPLGLGVGYRPDEKAIWAANMYPPQADDPEKYIAHPVQDVTAYAMTAVAEYLLANGDFVLDASEDEQWVLSVQKRPKQISELRWSKSVLPLLERALQSERKAAP